MLSVSFREQIREYTMSTWTQIGIRDLMKAVGGDGEKKRTRQSDEEAMEDGDSRSTAEWWIMLPFSL